MTDLKERFRTLDRLAPPDLWADAERRRPGTQLDGPERRRLVTAAVAFLVAAVGVALTVQTFRGSERESSTLAAAENGMIAFSGFDGSTWQIYAVAEDGTGLTQLTTLSDPQIALDPAWSPDGSQIAFVIQNFEGGLSGQADIYVMNADGTAVTRLTDGPGSSGQPAWSPDGSRIAFFRWDLGGPEDIYVMDADGTDVLRLTDDRTGDKHPAWSPDGSRIVFQGKDQGGNVDVYVMNADGSGSTTLTAGPGFEGEPAWSPDGTQIAFTAWSSEATNLGGISVMDVDGTGVRELTFQPIVAQSAAWSPDGAQIVFMAQPPESDGEAEAIYLMNADGTGLHQLTGLPEQATWPAWQPVPATATTPTPTETATPTQSPTTLNPEVVATIPVGAFPRAVEVGDGSVWATVDNATGGPNGHLLVRIDPATNEIVETIPIREAGDLAVGAGSLWVTSSQDGGVVLRIDPTTYELLTAIPVGPGLSNVEFGLSAVWVTLNAGAEPPSGEVVRIDPTTNDIVARVPVIGGWPRDIAIGEGSVWVYGHSRHTGDVWEASSLWRIDPVTNELVATVLDQVGFLGDGGFSPDNVAVGEGGVWAADDRGNGVWIDPATGALTRFEVEGGFSYPFMVYAGRIWFGLSTISALDIRTLEVDATLVDEFYAVDIALDPATGTLWLANYEGSVTRIALR